VAGLDLQYESLQRQLEDAGVVTSLAELHGGMCGTMCIGGIAATQRWLDDCLEDWRLAESETVSAALRGLELDAWRGLTSTDMSFEPLVPGDNQSLEAQVRGLALWCHGFLTGLGFGGFEVDAERAHRSQTVEEITKDFSEISRAGLGDEEEEEAEETGFALAELKEYVRVGVQLVFEEYGARQLNAGSNSIH
jgi:uncharacterized protein YgfB (UPF0149 family)